jgi:hypothetical protein
MQLLVSSWEKVKKGVKAWFVFFELLCLCFPLTCRIDPNSSLGSLVDNLIVSMFATVRRRQRRPW